MFLQKEMQFKWPETQVKQVTFSILNGRIFATNWDAPAKRTLFTKDNSSNDLKLSHHNIPQTW